MGGDEKAITNFVVCFITYNITHTFYFCNYSHPNYKPKPKGSHKIEYEEDDRKRANKKWKRKIGLVKSAHDLGVITGGEVFVKFRGPPNPETGKRDIWVYSASDDMYAEYKKGGIKPSTDVKEGRLDKDGDMIDTIKIFKSKQSSTISKASTSDGMEVSLLPESYYVTPTKTVVGADLNFANITEEIIGISTIDLPAVAEFVNVTADEVPLAIEFLPEGEDPQNIAPPTSTPVIPVNGAQGISHDSLQVTRKGTVGVNSYATGRAEAAGIAHGSVQIAPQTSTPVIPVNGAQGISQDSLQVTPKGTVGISPNPTGRAEAAGIAPGSVQIAPRSTDEVNPRPTEVGVIASGSVQSTQPNTVSTPAGTVAANIPSVGLTGGAGIAAASDTTRPKDFVKKLIAKKIKFKQEQKPTEVVKCPVCDLKKLKKDAKWKWKSCMHCEKEVHTLCVGMSKTDKRSTFTCEACTSLGK